MSQQSLQLVACDTVETMPGLSYSFSVVVGADNSRHMDFGLWPSPSSCPKYGCVAGSHFMIMRKKDPVSLMGLAALTSRLQASYWLHTSIRSGNITAVTPVACILLDTEDTAGARQTKTPVLIKGHIQGETDRLNMN